jgi:hypothetical protein
MLHGAPKFMAIERVIRNWPFRATSIVLTFAAAASIAIFAQTVPQQVPQQAVPQQSPPTPPTPPPAPVFTYEGKPITLPYRCSIDDIRWAGLTCSDDEPCPIYLELSSAEAIGERVFAAGNIHSDAVTLYSVLLSSPDGGHSWQISPDSVRGAGLDRIQLLDALTGWISGQTLSPLPQDPFFLLTSDGGKSWRMNPVFTDNHFGVIQQFAFDSKSTGALIVDNGPGGDLERYARFETADGGETWTIKEQNKKPLQLKRPAAPAPTWRVRADAATRSYRIEHRAGNQWTAAAAFSVKLPSCKPE